MFFGPAGVAWGAWAMTEPVSAMRRRTGLKNGTWGMTKEGNMIGTAVEIKSKSLMFRRGGLLGGKEGSGTFKGGRLLRSKFLASLVEFVDVRL
jgi:hypothetical protein